MAVTGQAHTGDYGLVVVQGWVVAKGSYKTALEAIGINNFTTVIYGCSKIILLV